MTTPPVPSHPSTSRRAHCPRRAALVALAASLANAVLGAYWATGGRGFPFAPGDDPLAHVTLLATRRQDAAGWLIAVVSAALAAVALAMLRVPADRRLHRAVLAAAWVACASLLVVVPDARVLVAVAYAPMFVLGAPFGWPPVSYGQLVPWPVPYQAACMGAGLAWGAAALGFARCTGRACPRCGRARAARWWRRSWVARTSVPVAVAVPLLYAATRYAWAAGLPLGITDAFWRDGRESGLWWAGAGLATVAVAGAVLTVGLVRPWGERFPRWIPVLRGRAVPPLLPVALALPVAALVTSVGLGALRTHVAHGFPAEGWGTTAPGLLWPLWGVALAVAALAYHDRRAGPCAACRPAARVRAPSKRWRWVGP